MCMLLLEVYNVALIACLAHDLDVFGEGKYMGKDEGTQVPTIEELEGAWL